MTVTRLGYGCALALAAAAVATFAAQPVAAQIAWFAPSGQTAAPAVPPSLAQDRHYQAWMDYYRQRAYPNGIPAHAYQDARQYYDQTWPGSRAPSAAPLSVNNWAPIGPAPITQPPGGPESGRITTIAVHPTNPNIIYIGAADGGVWKTTDGGTTWTPLTDTQCTTAMGAIAIDPVNPNIIYAGTGEWNGSPVDARTGCGILRSTDGGTTWTTMLPGRYSTQVVAIDPATAGSTTGTHVFAASSLGLVRSTDSGATWALVLGLGDGSNPISDLAALPGNVVYAAIGNVSGSANNGLYKSTDGGATFNKLVSTSNGACATTANPNAPCGRLNFGIAPSNPMIIYMALQGTSPFGSLYSIVESTDGGATFNKRSATGAVCSPQCWYTQSVTVLPGNPDIVFFGGLSLYVSSDSGNTFNDIGTGGNADFPLIHVDQHALVFQPGSQLVVYAGNDGGIYKSTDGGGTWTSLNTNLAISQFYPSFSPHPTNASMAFGGLQDNGCVLWSGTNAWTNVPNFGDCGGTAIDYTTPTTAYAQNGGVAGPYREDDFPSANGNDWVHKINGIPNDGVRPTEKTVFAAAPLVMSAANSQTLYYGTCKVYKTTNRGDLWTAISPVLVHSGNCDPATGDAVTTIAEAKSNPQVLYAGTDEGDVWVTTNGGANWTNINVGPVRYVSRVAIDPINPQNAFATFSGFDSQLFPGHVFKTTDAGASGWTNITGNLPNIPVDAILLDPSAPTTHIFVGTDMGLFQTTDGGTTWTPFNNSMPNTAVVDLVYNQKTNVLFAATHGRSAWTANMPSVVCGPTAAANSASPATPGTLAASHDFNDDDKSDIAWRNVDGTASLWLMNGGQVLQAGDLGLVPINWSVVGQRDFNGDCSADLLWRDANTGTVAMWFMNGLQVASSAGLGPVSSNWTIFGTGDLNGDGKGDLLWRDSNTGTVSIWFMNGAAVASTASLGAVPNNWVIVGSDNNGDIFWRDSNTGAVAIWRMSGGKVVLSASPGVVPSNWVIAGYGDFNGDGVADILWRDSNSGTVAIWLLNGDLQVQSSGSLGVVSSNWTIAQTGDYNGDGKSDIVWIDQVGDTAIWFMNGAAVASTVGLGDVSDRWTVQSTNAE